MNLGISRAKAMQAYFLSNNDENAAASAVFDGLIEFEDPAPAASSSERPSAAAEVKKEEPVAEG